MKLTQTDVFEPQPTLEGRYVRMRAIEESDLEALYALANDPAVWEQHPASNRYQRPIFETYFRDHLLAGKALVAFDIETDAMIGASRFNDYNPETRSVEIGWTFLAKSHWGGTYNSDMKHIMLDHAFKSLDTVLFQAAPDNIRSKRAIMKLGARLFSKGTGRGGNDQFELPKAVYMNQKVNL